MANEDNSLGRKTGLEDDREFCYGFGYKILPLALNRWGLLNNTSLQLVILPEGLVTISS